MKRYIVIFLIIVICLSLCVPVAFAAETDDGSSSGGGFSGGWDEGSSSGGGFSGEWDENGPFDFTGDKVTAWTVTVYIFKVGFTFVYKLFSELMMITDTVSAWDFIMLCVFVSGVLAIISIASGSSSGTTGSGNSADGVRAKRRRRDEE